MLAKILILTSLFLPQAQSNTDIFGVESLVNGAKTVLRNVPENRYKCALDNGLEMLGLNAYASEDQIATHNAGLSKYGDDYLQKRPCLARRTAEFWIEILKTERKLELKYETPSFADYAGRGDFKKIPPGKLWELALKATDQDPNAALQMIGLCTTSPSGPSVKFNLKDQIYLQRLTLDFFNDSLRELERKRSNSSAGPDEDFFLLRSKNELTNMIERTTKRLANLKSASEYEAPSTPVCQGFHPLLYLPGAMGKDADIPQSLKDKISSIQNRPLDSIAAKSYHIYTAALFGCAFKSCDISPSTAAWAQGRLGSAYRTVRLCQDTKDNLALKEEIERLTKVPYGNSKEFKHRILELSETLPSECEGQTASCKFLERMNLIGDKSVREMKADRLIAQIDASILYRKWYLGGSGLAALLIPCTDVRTGGPAELTGRSITGSECKIEGWSQQKCKTAIAKLATWDVDIEWTKTQHQVGARFGAEKCEKSPPKPDSELCKLPPFRIENLEETKQKGSGSTEVIQ